MVISYPQESIRCREEDRESAKLSSARYLLVPCSAHARYMLGMIYMLGIESILWKFFVLFCCLLFFPEKDRKYSNPTKSSVTAWKEKSYMDWRYPGWYINNILFVTLFYKKKHQSEIKKRSLTVYMDWRHPGWYIYYVILLSPCFITKIAFQSFRVTILKKVIIQLWHIMYFFKETLYATLNVDS